VRRWLLAFLGLLIAVGAFYWLLSPGEPEHNQIDAESRAKLREVLREDREP